MANPILHPDDDPTETQEWLDALHSLLRHRGSKYTEKLLIQLLDHSRRLGLPFLNNLVTPYVNTISKELEPNFPGDERLEDKITALVRWNALVMVLRAGKKAPELGGHLASYASAATLYEVGFNHFFRAPSATHGGDLVFIQGHSSPGIYARAFLEGRLSAEQLDRFRQEIEKPGLSSYPHPKLMPTFWQFPTVSMGIGPLQAIYQARFLKYLHNRGLINTEDRKVWVFCGDGEMDEPESVGALGVASREELDNLIFVINCNLQRLDGPVRGNSSIINELERLFRGAGWNVIKVLWGSNWDPLFSKDRQGWLIKRMSELVDGDYQNYSVKDGAYIREHFFSKYTDLAALVANLSDNDLKGLTRGGHDSRKVYTAYKAAYHHKKQPTVILAKTVKGYGLGSAGEGQNITHQNKKLAPDQLKAFCQYFNLSIDEPYIENLDFYHPGENSEEIHYLHKRRQELGGYLPARRTQASETLPTPPLSDFSNYLKGSDGREFSTTMACVRILNSLLKDKKLGKRLVPIIPDEARTFGMEGFFRQIGIYSPIGQLYQPPDAGQLACYREDKQGQLLEEGINEPGAFCSWMAAASSYSVNDYSMIPFYIYYSMFGFQRVGDLVWAAADLQARGFILGATAGRTTLAGEGLQHQDGQNLLFFSVIPNCRAYDPAFQYELAVIIQHGLSSMIECQENFFYYLTLMNENYVHPPMPKASEAGIIQGMYLLSENNSKYKVQLLGSGTILREVIAASQLLFDDFGIAADIWSVTSFSELRKEALEAERYNRLHPMSEPKTSYLTRCLQDREGPVIAATDYVRLNADQIRAFIPKRRYIVLGTDGFGRSDTRRQLRNFFEISAPYIVIAALQALADEKAISITLISQAINKYRIDTEKADPFYV